ncbi:LOW QUALITY PROTEIN: cohesin subunit SA-3-like [Myiozetetes cayanensis]|uniref:LOW QUALITY PROTEIN: cohesin subunit SA-3-like n=1 Tax=Myiozetetes cayanensis TaxID=478635 RepID=UPI00215F0B55|nr:LOW QUALITY PROTEIN: cohesin subunit SA-3-like [Myiozetetes cayanensis]
MAPQRSPRTRSSGTSGASGASRSSSVPTAGSGAQSSPPTSPHTPEFSSDPDSGSDFESTLPARKRRGRPQRSNQGPIPKRSRRSNGNEKNPEENSLFQAVLSGKAAVETLVDEWLELYKRDRESGLLELLNFIVRACGCRGVVTPEMFRELQNSQIIQQLTEKFKEESPEYPLSLSSRPWRRFRAGFSELVAGVVRRGRYGVVYDGFLMDSWISFLTGLSDSQVRAFRHTSTLAALKAMTALVEVALDVHSQQENTQRQLEAERGKELGRRGTEKMEALLGKRRELLEQQEEIEVLMNVVFKGVFVHRYRDVVPEIRALCMEELGKWMSRFPGSFLTDSYLKYIGWTLHDKQGEVRLQCVKALQGIYGNPDVAPQLELFTGRFKPRIVAMAQDKEPEVALEVVKLQTLLVLNVEDSLSEEDCQGIYPLVFVANRALASAAGTFLFHRLLDPQKHGNGNGDNRTFFRRLVTFFLDTELHEHAAYLVDSLWDCAGPRLRDWDTATGLLLEHSPALQDREEKALVEVVACSALQVAQGHPPVGRAGPRKVSSKERKEQEEEKSRLSRCLIPVLPQLLEKFSADADPAASLLTVLRHLELGMFHTGRMEKALVQVLVQVQEVFGKHRQRRVLDSASRALHALCDPQVPLHGRARVTRGLLGDSLGDRCHLQVTEVLQAEAPDEEDLYGLATTLRRISALFNGHDLTPWKLFGPCSRLLRHAVDTGELPPQVTVPALSCLFFHVLWELSRLPGPDVPQAELQSLRSKALSLLSLCQSCLSDPSHALPGAGGGFGGDLGGLGGLGVLAFVVLSDLLVVLGPRLPRVGGPWLERLVLPVDPGLHSQLAAVLMDRVFQHPPEPPRPRDTEEAEAGLGELQQRRRLLAGFCKLVIHEGLEIRAASDLFKHYGKFHGDFGDILKETLRWTRDMDRMEWARTLLLSLQQLLTELLLQQGPQIRGLPEFQEIRDLARRFSLFFSLHRLRNRPALLGLHREGIQFAFQEPPDPEVGEGVPLNLPFLEVLSEFSPRLLRPDKALLLSFVERTLQERGGLPPGVSPWPPLVTYRQSLSPQGGGETPPEPPRAKRPRPRETPSEPPSSSPWPQEPPHLHCPQGAPQNQPGPPPNPR